VEIGSTTARSLKFENDLFEREEIEAHRMNEELVLNCLSFLKPEEAFSLIERMAFEEGARKAQSHLFRDEYFKRRKKQDKRIALNCLHEKSFENEYLRDALFELIFSRGDVVIAGGFAAQLWLELRPSFSSDIDVFVLKEEGMSEISRHLRARKDISFIEAPSRRESTSIFQVSIRSIPFKVQFIRIFRKETPVDILEAFDFSHCKCMIYRGKLYASPDAERSLRTRESVLYSNEVRVCRVKKALRYVKKIINCDTRCCFSCACEQRAWDVSWARLDQIPEISKKGENYFSNKNHSVLKRKEAVRHFDVLSSFFAPAFSFLEECAQAKAVPTFSFTYTEEPKSCGIFDPSARLFCTKEKKKFAKLLRFWDSIKEGVLETNKKSNFCILNKRFSQRIYFRQMLDSDWFCYFNVDGIQFKHNFGFKDGERYTFELKQNRRGTFIMLL
jgi:hypothetical protein